MAATPFTDDAYNKQVSVGNNGTLVGNWFEEYAIREATGEGRTVPQRHIKRSGMLTDWTKVPSSGPRKQDNTFERVYGQRMYEVDIPVSHAIGGGDEEHVVRKPIADTLQAEGRVRRVGPRELMARSMMAEAAEEAVAQEDMIEAEKMNAREFDTSTGVAFAKPDETLVEYPTHARVGMAQELMHGKAAARGLALKNAGLEANLDEHYSTVETVSHARMAFADPLMRSDMKVSAPLGVSCFGKHSEFSKPMGEFSYGQGKDHEVNMMLQTAKTSQPLRNKGCGTAPTSTAFAEVPSLTGLKEKVKNKLMKEWGPHAYITLRQKLYEVADHEGFVGKDAVVSLLRSELGLEESEVSETALGIYLGQQFTTKKTAMRVSALLTSLRPAMTLDAKKRVLEAFNRFGPKEGNVPLGDWLAMTNDDLLRKTLVEAFGGSDEASVADLLVTEQMFVEFYADLVALASLDGLL